MNVAMLITIEALQATGRRILVDTETVIAIYVDGDTIVLRAIPPAEAA